MDSTWYESKGLNEGDMETSGGEGDGRAGELEDGGK